MENKFEINSCVYCLKIPADNNKSILFDDKTNYIIPIYQRPYSWGEKEIRSFIESIFNSYLEEDNLFIGTIQLSYLKGNTQDIIDGQQRITTILLFLKALSLRFKIKYDICNKISINTDNKIYQKMFDNVIELNKLDDINQQNKYTENIRIIYGIINELLTDEDNNAREINIDKFIEHLFTNIYFVAIKTNAGLSKTIQIFDAINTTGLDLDTSNIFKIRMFEYLKDKMGFSDEDSFEQINSIYSLVVSSQENSDTKFSINEILSIYQKFIISKYSLPNEMFDFSQERFFDEIFSDILKKNPKWNNVNLDIKDIKEIIECRLLWERIDYITLEDSLLNHLLGWSRYSKYWILTFLFLKRFIELPESERIEKLYLFRNKIIKFFVIYSILYAKSI